MKMMSQMTCRGLEGASPALQRPPMVVFWQNSANKLQITPGTPIIVLGISSGWELSYIDINYEKCTLTHLLITTHAE